MNKRLRSIGKLVNKAVNRVGIKIVRTNAQFGDIGIYPDKERPDIPRYINIGAGSFYHPFWHNMDTPNTFYSKEQKGHIHIDYDLKSKRSFPFKSNTLKVAYMSHVIEHLTNECVQFSCAEVYRCLQPNGYFRITCPDIDLEYDAYCRRDETFFPCPTPWRTYSSSIEQRFLEHFATALTLEHPETKCQKFTDDQIRAVFSRYSKEEALAYFISQISSEPIASYPEHHVNWFNVNKLQRILKEVGFKQVYESRYGQSKCALMRNTQLFDFTAPGLSFYMECQK